MSARRKDETVGLIQEHMANEETWLTTGDVARLLHVSPKTVARWASEGKVKHIITLGGHRRFPSSAVADLARRSAPSRTQPPA